MAHAFNVTKIAHLALGAPDLDRSAAFYTDRWGLQVSAEGDDTLFFRAGEPDHHVLQLTQGESAVDHLAFEVASRDDLERAAEALAARGVEIVTPPGAAVEPGVVHALRFRDPEGYVVELIAGVDRIAEPYGAREVKPEKLSHTVLQVADLDAMTRFYTDALGFRLSDTVLNPHGETMMAFLRCNRNHHAIALQRTGTHGLGHVAFEVQDWATLGRAILNLGESGVKRVWGPGHHTADDSLFSYFLDPDENAVEYLCQFFQIPDEETWQPRQWRAADHWGSPPPLFMLRGVRPSEVAAPGAWGAPAAAPH